MMCHSSPFIQKLQAILNDASNSDVISFNEVNKRLEIYDKKKLEQILPKYFKHSKFDSFARQLNWYGFYKIINKNFHFYAHPDLQKGVKLASIKSRRNQSRYKTVEEENQPADCIQEKEQQDEEIGIKNSNCQYIFKLQNPWSYNNPFTYYLIPQNYSNSLIALLQEPFQHSIIFTLKNQLHN